MSSQKKKPRRMVVDIHITASNKFSARAFLELIKKRKSEFKISDSFARTKRITRIRVVGNIMHVQQCQTTVWTCFRTTVSEFRFRAQLEAKYTTPTQVIDDLKLASRCEYLNDQEAKKWWENHR